MEKRSLRVDGRTPEQIRPVRISPGAIPFAEGSAEVVMGGTRLLAAATVDRATPEQVQAGSSGKVFASVSVLPRSTPLRLVNPVLTEALRSELQTIQSLVVRSLRAALPGVDLGDINLTVDCSVICSDAGIAGAAISASWVAMYEALRWAALHKLIRDDLHIVRVAAVSAGLVQGKWLLDLCAEEATNAEFIANIVLDEKGKIVDLKASQEGASVDLVDLASLLQRAAAQAQLIFKEEERAALQIK